MLTERGREHKKHIDGREEKNSWWASQCERGDYDFLFDLLGAFPKNNLIHFLYFRQQVRIHQTVNLKTAGNSCLN